MGTPTSTWRSVRKDDYPNGTVVDGKAVEGVLYPDFEKRQIAAGSRKGEWRAADVYLKDGFVYPDGGTSLFDKADVFGTKYWCCFFIPEGTVLPECLVVSGPVFNQKFAANHYQIEARTRIRIDSFKAALDNLARNAVVRARELSK